MASWKLCFLVVFAVLFVLSLEVDGGRRKGRRRNIANNDGGGNAVVSRRRGGRRRGGRFNPGLAPGQDGDTDGDGVADGADTGPPGRTGGGRRGGRGRGRGGRPGRRQRPGGRGRGRGRGHGGRRRPTLNGNARRLLGDYSLSNGHFGMGLYGEMTKTRDNFVISPLSIHSALGMLLLGSAGQTKRQLVRGMHIRSPIHPAFKIYNQSLQLGEGVNTTLMLANNIYIRSDFSPKDRFINKLRMFYGSEVSEFDDEDPEGEINDWVAEKTRNKIEDFLDDGEVTDDMAMMLINAVYFKGLWKDAFDEEDTGLETFTDMSSETHDVYMLRRSGQYKMHYSDVLGAQTLKIPYKGDRYSLNIILPDENINIDIMESRMTHDVLNQTLHSLHGQHTSMTAVSLPKFSLDTEESMKEMLQALGINDVFTDRANLRKMTTSTDVLVNKVKHRCVMEVDEQGTEAAATTGIGIVTVSLPMPFTANRPFMFVLRDDHTSVNLFMGRYVNPNGDGIME